MDLISIDTPDTSDVYIFNPMKSDFVYTILGTEYVLKSYEGQKFPKNIADLLATHLKDEIVNQRGKLPTDLMVEEIMKSIYLK